MHETKRDGVKVVVLETGDVFNSIKSCADYIGASPSCVGKIVKGDIGYRTCKGYHIEALDDPISPKETNRTKVVIIETGMIFKSIRECARSIGGSPSAISNILNKKNYRTTHKGYHFEKVK